MVRSCHRSSTAAISALKSGHRADVGLDVILFVGRMNDQEVGQSAGKRR
jgi:hypothetical protein